MTVMKKQFRVLYRDFLFRIVDRELLSTYATGDASQLLLQIIALLLFLSVIFSIPVLSIHSTAPTQVRLMFAWRIEHFLIATTMLLAGSLFVPRPGSKVPRHCGRRALAPLSLRAHYRLLG